MNSNFDSKESFLSYKLNIFKELYNDERERRNIASQKISRIIPLIVAMFGGNTYADACLTRITDKHHTYRLDMKIIISDRAKINNGVNTNINTVILRLQ